MFRRMEKDTDLFLKILKENDTKLDKNKLVQGILLTSESILLNCFDSSNFPLYMDYRNDESIRQRLRVNVSCEEIGLSKNEISSLINRLQYKSCFHFWITDEDTIDISEELLQVMNLCTSSVRDNYPEWVALKPLPYSIHSIP